jgi:membrane-bound lytic murein transglycosylase B
MRPILPLGAVILLILSLASCAPETKKEETVAHVPDQAFQNWLADFKSDALSKGISQQTLNEAFASTEPIDRVIELDRKQPESTMTLEEYLQKVVSAQRISQGKELYSENRALLDQISAEYGVPGNYIVALWGIETNYGNNTGGFSIVDSLATLAYDGRRSEYFRGELINALKIIDADHIDAIDMDGSWAGAMGQCQFMPSSFLSYAVDYNHDGKRDIWNTQEDVFASIANYLHSSGWNNDEENNFNVLLKWNRSRYFATAVQKIAQGIIE